MRTLRLPLFRLAGLPGRLMEAATPVKTPLPVELSLSPLPSTPAHDPMPDWERLWIDLGGEG
jgi:hypothetical protein